MVYVYKYAGFEMLLAFAHHDTSEHHLLRSFMLMHSYSCVLILPEAKREKKIYNNNNQKLRIS